MDELEFRRASDTAIEALKQELFDTEEDGGFEVEEQNGVLCVLFEDPPAKFVITPNNPVRQIWISALSTSFKLDIVDGQFVFPKTGQTLIPLVKSLIEQQIAQA
jgi:CyaY protein